MKEVKDPTATSVSAGRLLHFHRAVVLALAATVVGIMTVLAYVLDYPLTPGSFMLDADVFSGTRFGDQPGVDQCRGPVGIPGAVPKAEYDLTKQGPFAFLPNFRNPCWREPEGSLELKCLPYFYLAGFPKCGTSDLYNRIIHHPGVAKAPYKEPHWIARFRFLHNSSLRSLKDFDSYTRFFAEPLQMFNRTSADNVSLITGDGSASTAWDVHVWYKFPGNENCSEPRVINADYIRHLVPDARIIIRLRNPTDRLYSDYTYVKRPNGSIPKSKEDFHRKVEQQLLSLNACLKTRSLRSCAYDGKLNRKARVYVGLYTVFIEDWLLRFPHDQILVMRLEDAVGDMVKEMRKVFWFLGLKQLDIPTMQKISGIKKVNVQTKYTGAMMEKTRVMLDNFYRPFNKRLATVLGDDRYTWEDKPATQAKPRTRITKKKKRAV